jgi:hypothetical protein
MTRLTRVRRPWRRRTCARRASEGGVDEHGAQAANGDKHPRRFHLSHAQHREELHQVNEERQAQMQKQTKLLVETLEQNTTLTQDVEALLRQNTDLTQTIRTLAERIETMTAEVHARLAAPARS